MSNLSKIVNQTKLKVSDYKAIQEDLYKLAGLLGTKLELYEGTQLEEKLYEKLSDVLDVIDKIVGG